MRIAEISIHRHVLALMASVVIVLFGIIAFTRIGVDRTPNVEFPLISVTTVLPGASPEVMDASVTAIIESAANSIPGIDFIQSQSSPSTSSVAVTFELSKDIDVAFAEVQAKVNQILRQLPDEADPPVVAKTDIGAQPIYWMALQGDRTVQQLNQYARQVVKKRLQTIDGVGDIRIGGERRRTIRVNIDVDRMAAAGVTTQDIRAAFQREHITVPGGYLVGGPREQLIELDLEFHTPQSLSDMIVREVAGAPVRLRDFSQVEDGLDDNRTMLRYMGKPTVGIGVIKIANANTVAIVDEVRRRVDEEIRPQLPAGMTLVQSVDLSQPIREIVSSLEEHLFSGTILAALVVWVFLRSWRSTAIIATAIPVSLLGAVAGMYFMDFTFNQMTLLALLLLIGVVVDDAIVVLENIHRHREHVDPDPVTAAVEGTRQVGFAVVASSLTLVSIFASVLFLEGMIGRFFVSFAVVVTIGVLVSLFVSVTLTPMLCSRFLDVNKEHGRLYHAFDRFFERLDTFYTRSLAWSLQHRWRVLGVTTLIVLSSGFFVAMTEKTFSPDNDEGRIQLNYRAPLGTSREATESYMKALENVITQYPEVAATFVHQGMGGSPNSGGGMIVLKPRDERDRSQDEVLADVRRGLAQIPGIRAFAAVPGVVGGGRGEQLQFAVIGPDLGRVAEIARQLQTRLQGNKQLASLDMDLQIDLPMLRLEVDRTRAAAAGITPADVAFALNMLAGGTDIARYNDDPGDGDRYDIRVKAKDGQLRTADDLSHIMLRSSNGQLIRLDSLARVTNQLGPAVINRYDLRYAAQFYGQPAGGLSTALAEVEAAAAQIIPAGYEIKLLGSAREFQRTGSSLILVFGLALSLVFIVLASQFNSFIQPVIVMMAQPLAIVGGLFALWVSGSSLNIYSMIGMVLLVGLVAKNSILLVDLTNQVRATGRGIDEALLEACPIRLRPVLMTSLTVILALLPTAMGFGAGAATNGPLAIAVVGGMISSTLMTLVVVPASYSVISHALVARSEGRLRWNQLLPRYLRSNR